MGINNRRIIIIDDDEPIWEAYRAILSDCSKQSLLAEKLSELERNVEGKNVFQPEEYELFFCSQGQEGFELVKKMHQQDKPFAVSFIDLRMPPGWDGVKTAIKIREVDPEIEIVIVTAYGDYSLEEIVHQVGRPDRLLFLRKPFDVEEISQFALSLTEKWNMARKDEQQKENLEKAYAELKTIQDHLIQQEKMASIGLLAAGVAHEINNPVGFITSNLNTLSKYIDRFREYISVLKNFIKDESEEELKELNKKLKIDFVAEDAKDLVNESLDGTNRLSKIVQGLKNFSRDDGAEHKSSDINECLETTINIVWNELKYKATVNKEYGDLPLTKCYPQQLNQVFMNLLVNASHAIEKQGEISIKTCHQDDSIFVSISDTGSGISEENLNKLFEPFFTTKEVGKGTGLGLSIVSDIIKKHEGDISVESELGKGTTFTIQIPVVES